MRHDIAALLIVYASALFAVDPAAVDTVIHRNEAGKRIYVTQRLQSRPPHIDGRLTDECWLTEGVWSGNFKQQIPTEGAQPSAATEIKILYDDRNIYVAIRAHDDPKLIDRQRGRRDDFSGDIVGVCFDSYFDHRTGFEFDLTAGGSKIDLILTNERWDPSWDAVWDGQVAFEDSAWTAEFRIPLSQLRYAEREEQRWGLHSWRWINRNMEEDQWALIPRDTPGRMYDIGELHGIRNLPKNRRIELLPYGRSQLEQTPREAENPFRRNGRPSQTAGLDGKIGLSSNFTMDFTVNPDFGQVEADPAVLNLTVFETFYEEKRPFFLEGKSIFSFNLEENPLFYSRRIGHSPSYSPELTAGQFADLPQSTAILGAAKVSGKSNNGLSIGILESVTREEQARIADGDHRYEKTVEPQANYFVARVQQEFNGSNTLLGGIVTAANRRITDSHLDFLSRNAHSGGIDFLHHWKKKTYYVDAKAVFSAVEGDEAAILNLQRSSARYFQRPDADYVEVDSGRTQLLGHGALIRFGKRGNGNWRWQTGVSWRSPGLELNDLGFMPETDVIQTNVDLGYVENRPSGFFRSWGINAGVDRTWNFGRELLGNHFRLESEADLVNKWQIFWNVIRENDQLDMRLLRGGPAVRVPGWWHTMGRVGTDPSKRVSGGLRLHAHHHDDRISKTLDVGPFINWKATSIARLSANVSYSATVNALQYVTALPAEVDARYLLAELDRKTLGITLRFDIALTPELTVQYYANPYVSVGRYSNFKTVAEPRAGDLNRLCHILEGEEIDNDAEAGRYLIRSSNGDQIPVDNPDFSFREIRSNLVARWEFRPGSTLYLVWTHGRSQYDLVARPTLENGVDGLLDGSARNIFLLKFNYWFSI